MTDSVQLKLRQRATIMLKVCELAESHRPETDKAMTPEDELKVDEIYQLLSRAMDLPPTASWLRASRLNAASVFARLTGRCMAGAIVSNDSQNWPCNCSGEP
jgi:aminopeptidase C